MIKFGALPENINNLQQLSRLIYVSFIIEIISRVIALSAAKTLRRLRPEGVGINNLVKHHNFARNAQI